MTRQANYDVIIIGGGAAGISAALWCAELKLKALLLEKADELGGQLLWTYNAIENHLGTEAENGQELRDIFVRQIEKRDFKLSLNSRISEVDLSGKTVILTSGEKIFARALIIATGIRRRTLGVEGEEKFRGRGIISSGKRDKDRVKGKNVLIVGGGDAALENSLILAETAEKIYVAHRRSEFRARPEFLGEAEKISKIEFLPTTVLQKIKGSQNVESVELKDLSKEKTYDLPVDAVLFRIGVKPNAELFTGQLDLDEKGYVKVDSFGQTNVPGIYAAGDIANPVAPTVSSAVGMGATAVKAIYSRLK